MSKLLDNLVDDESENDSDYVPEEERNDDDSSSDAAGPDPKRLKVEERTAEECEQEKKARDIAWTNFQASLAAPRSTDRPVEVKTIKIEKKYKFAGEEIIKAIEVPEDSNEARVWAASQTANPPNVIASPASSTSVPEACFRSPFHSSTLAPSPSPLAPPVRSTPTSSTSSTISGITPKTTTTRPKKAGGLSALLTARPKKISGLEKSRLDWNEHISSESTDFKSELEANRRGGGFLAKMDFLGRVEGRRENIDAAKGKRKR